MKRRRLLAMAAASASALLPLAPMGADYIRPDGSIYIVGDRALEPLLTTVNELYRRAHPQARFTLMLREAPVGIDGIVAGVSLLAPVAHDAWDGETEAFKRLYGYAPLDVRVGRFAWAGPGRSNPPSIYVNARNPLASLTLQQVARIFTSGMAPSDLRRWDQLGVRGDWSTHLIHAYGTRDDGTDLTQLRLDRLGGHPFAAHYEPLEQAAAVLDAVARDAFGIGLVGFVHADRMPDGVRRIPLAMTATSPATLGAFEDVRAGLYPLSPYLHVYIDVPPGYSIDPVVQEYVSLMLSRAGQESLDLARAGGLVPLAASEAEHERTQWRVTDRRRP
jgi:phosphate transport system substrate-binding protein